MAGSFGISIRRSIALLGGCAAVAAPFAAHVAIVTGHLATMASVLAAAQLVLLLVAAWRLPAGWQRRLAATAACALAAVLVLRIAGPQQAGKAGLVAGAAIVHAMLYASLLVLFGQSLWPGRVPLVTGLALRMRGALTPAMLGYTRTVTKAWCVFFLAELVLSAVLLAFAPAWVWSWVVNASDGPAIVAMFLVEFTVRRLRFRAGGHTSPLAMARSFVRGRANG